MENVSKALLITAGVLLAILTISALVLAFNKINDVNKSKEQAIATEQILKFNAEYEAYNKENLYGADVITILNKAYDNNNKQNSNAMVYRVDVRVILNDLHSALAVETSSEITLEQYRSNVEKYKEAIKEKVFYCEAINYGKDGRANEIIFIEDNESRVEDTDMT